MNPPSDFQIDPGFWSGLMEASRDSERRAILDLIDRLRGFGLTGSRVSINEAAFFHHSGLRGALDHFRRQHPNAPLPLERITWHVIPSPGECRAEINALIQSILSAQEEMAHFANTLGIPVDLHVFFGQIDPSSFDELARTASAHPFDQIGFYFHPNSETEAVGLDPIRVAIKDLLQRAAFRSDRIVWGNLPFCAYPESSFTTPYRDALQPLLGRIHAQREWVKKVREQSTPMPVICSTCRCRQACHRLSDIRAHTKLHDTLRPRSSSEVVFIGGSLPPNERPPSPDRVYARPAAQGDLIAAVLDGFSRITLIDGYFREHFPPTTGEVLLALESGVSVTATASIGALRGLELASHGIDARGEVIATLRTHEVKPYHWVAQSYGPDDQPLSEPPVHLQRLIDQARQDERITAQEHRQLNSVLDAIPFPDLTLTHFLSSINTPDLAPRMSQFAEGAGAPTLRLKPDDARNTLTASHPAGTQDRREIRREAFARKRSAALDTLFSLYVGDPDLTLKANQLESTTATELIDGEVRMRAPMETLRRARRFLSGLDLTLADTTGYDPAGLHVITAICPALYHLDYPTCSATGAGRSSEAAQLSACMELIERLPTTGLHIRQRSLREWGLAPYPHEALPQFANWGTDPGVHQKVIADHGYIHVTELNSRRTVLIPKAAAMLAYSGTDGFASGNTSLEAAYYGLCELVERDTARMHLMDADLREARSSFLIDPDSITHPGSREILRSTREKGLRLLVYDWPNVFGHTCAVCEVYDLHAGLQLHGGIAVRRDPESAFYSAMREAYLQYLTYYAGLRDDYRPFTGQRSAALGYQRAKSLYFSARGNPIPPAHELPKRNLHSDLSYLLSALNREGVEDVLVADLSPRPDFGLASVKVIAPGLDLWFCTDYRPSQSLINRADQLKRKRGLLR